MIGILVIDDEPIITDSICRMLTNEPRIISDSEIFKAYNAFEAQFIVENESIDLIVSDVNMPGLDGITFRNKLVESGYNCKFIFISGFSNFENIYSAVKISGTRFLLKTEPHETIINTILEVFNEIKAENPYADESISGDFSDKKFVKEVEEYINAHLGEELCLTALADHMHISTAHLSRTYKKLTGQNFSKHICQLKIERSKILLRETHKKIYEISKELGFATPSAFVFFFKKNIGMTPQQYRNSAI